MGYDRIMRSLFRFPNPVNETSARLVAAGVVVQTIVFFIFRETWMLFPLAYGFVARVLTGPTLSPLGQFVTRVVTPRVGGRQRLVPGPPKRFAQGVGTAFSVAGLIAWLSGGHTLAVVLIAFITLAATLESGFAICLGCIVFNRLMRWGIIPAAVCEECNDLTRRWTNAQPTPV